MVGNQQRGLWLQGHSRREAGPEASARPSTRTEALLSHRKVLALIPLPSPLLTLGEEIEGESQLMPFVSTRSSQVGDMLPQTPMRLPASGPQLDVNSAKVG